MRSTNITATLLFLTIVLVACSAMPAGTTQPVPTAIPTQTPLQALPTATVSLPTVVPPTETPAPPTGMPAVLRIVPSPEIIFFHMSDYLNGWAYTETQILHTPDGGMTWYDSTPGDVTGKSIRVSGSCFLDGGRAWLLLNSTETQVSLYRTTDGGGTWSMYSVPFTNGRIQFLDAMQGYVISLLGASVGSDAIAIFQTTDGGVTWTQVYTNLPGAEGAADSLPYNGLKSGMTYLDPLHAWVTGNIPMAGETYFYATQDGGVTWTRQELEMPPGFTEAMTEIEPPIFFTPQAGLLPVRLISEPPSFVFYVTLDGGANWEATFPLNISARYAASSLFDVFLWDGGEYLYVSHDSGETWDRLRTNVDLVMTFMDFEFVDANNGWALTGDTLSHHTFYRTVDGGVTWTLLIP